MPKPAPRLTVIPAGPGAGAPPPPPHLDAVGAALWRRVTADYEFSDPASYQILADACTACQRAEQLRKQIDADGVMLRTGKSSVRSNPLLRDQLQFLALTARLLDRLGLILSPYERPRKPWVRLRSSAKCPRRAAGLPQARALDAGDRRGRSRGLHRGRTRPDDPAAAPRRDVRQRRAPIALAALAVPRSGGGVARPSAPQRRAATLARWAGEADKPPPLEEP